MNEDGVDAFVYKEKDRIESFEMMARSSCKDRRKELKKNMLRRKYRLLMIPNPSLVNKTHMMGFQNPDCAI